MALNLKSRPGSLAALLICASLPIALHAQSYAYVANISSNNVSAFTIDPSTGALTPIAGSPFAAGSQSQSVTVDPSGKFAYVANTGSNNVSAYTINPSAGALTPVTGSPFTAGTQPVSVTVDASGKFVYVANFGSNNISAYAIDPSTGALTPIAGSAFAAGNHPFSVTVDPSDQFVYVANSFGNNISAYAINSSTGALTAIAGSPFPAGTQPESVTVDPSGKFVYVANFIDDNISAYAINPSTGALTTVAGSPFPAGTQPQSVAVDPSGKFVYVANIDSANVSAFTINPSSGALTPVAGSPFPAGNSPVSVTVGPSGKFVYVANNNNSPYVSVYTIDPATGALTPVAGSPSGSGPYSIVTVRLSAALSQDGSYRIAYAANLNIGDSVVNISNDGANGGFNPNPGGAGNICVNVYTFDPAEEEIACCACLVTPDGLNSLSVKSDLIGNTLTSSTPSSVVIKLVSSTPAADTSGALTVCNPGAFAGRTTGTVAWGNTLEPATSPATYGVVNVPFINGTLSFSEFTGLYTTCGFLQSNGSGFGICNSCRLGALGGAKK